MSGSVLNPVFAAELASSVYDIKKDTERRIFEAEYKDTFNLSDNSYTTGRTGGYIVKRRHVMALFTTGKDKYKGQAFVAIKGTASLYDALTDLNAGLRTSHTGFQVHQGFYYAFDSILTDLRKFTAKMQGVNVVHCIGHSLGGAIATLAADWLKANSGVSSVKLYTFGSPRVGLETFAEKCASRVKPENIYRVHHKTDPVPMVPTWPFYHVPKDEISYLLYSPLAAVPWEYHFMKHYIKSAKAAGSWVSMARSRPQSHMDYTVERWLKSDGFVSFTANSLELLNAALIYVIKKVLHLAGITIVSLATGTLTLLDRMAILLAKAVKISTELSSWVFYLVRKMAALIGITIKEGADLTVEFIRAVFMRVYRRIAEMISRIGMVLT